ncbi:MAG: retropepsin-like aspartic protease [Pseudomonadota bacterium]
MIDTGADITAISPKVAKQLGLKPTGKVPVRVPTGTGATNVYINDVVIPFGSSNLGGVAHWIQNLQVMEFNGQNPNYEGLLGRDIICQGTLTVGFDCRLVFCL